MIAWFDVDDLIRYFAVSQRPTGIQRLSFEVFRQVSRLSRPGAVRFCRQARAGEGFREVDFPALEAAILAAIACPQTPAAAPSPAAPQFSRLGLWLRRMPPRYRVPLGVIARALRQIAGALRDLALPGRTRPGALGGGTPASLAPDDPDVRFNPGDWLVNIGCAWHYPYDADMLAALRARGVKFGVLIYDLIPELFPEWTYRGTMLEFRGFLRRTLPAAEMIFTISQNTAADVRHFMLETKMPAVPIRVLPVGSRVATRSLCPPNPGGRAYVLFVSTIEVRKNHALMFRVWQRLLRQMPAGSVPDLVFAGKIGWLTNDFLHQLENADWLGGRIKFVETPTDEALETLYRNCLFTVFPSFYEGWGLPVTESLSFGKTVAASNRGSIPEAGGDFCVYYDPDHIEDAAGVIRGLIDHPARVAALEARIARQFRPPGWAETATMLLQALAQDHARDHAPDQAPDRAPAPAIMEQAA